MSPDSGESDRDEAPVVVSWAVPTTSMEGHLSLESPGSSSTSPTDSKDLTADVDSASTLEAISATTESAKTVSQSSTYNMQLVHVPRALATLHQKKKRLLSQRTSSSTLTFNIPIYPGPGPDSLTQYGFPSPSGVVFLDGNWVELSPSVCSMPLQPPPGAWYFGTPPNPPYTQYVQPQQQYAPPLQQFGPPPVQYNPPPGSIQPTRGMPPPPFWGFGNPTSRIPPGRMPPGPPPQITVHAGPDSDSESDSKEPRQYNPFDSSKSNDGASGSDSSEASASTDSTTSTKLDSMPHRPDIHLLPNGVDDTPDGSEGASPAVTEWERQKREFGDKNTVLDQVMSMVGIEEVKAEFLKVKATIEAARARKGRLRRQGLNMALMGNPGTGKRTIAALYRDFLSECGVWPDVANGNVHYELRSGSTLEPEDLHRELGRLLNGVFLFIDAIESLEKKHKRHLLNVLDWHADKLVVVLAGSPEGLMELLGSRPHGRWEFWRKLILPDYSDEQLRLILLRLIHHNSFELADGVDSRSLMIVAKRVGQGRGSEGFGNVYDLVVAFEKMLDRHSIRMDKLRKAKLKKKENSKKEPVGESQDEDGESNVEESEGDKKPEASDTVLPQDKKDTENEEHNKEDLPNGNGHAKTPGSALLTMEEPQEAKAGDAQDDVQTRTSDPSPSIVEESQKINDEEPESDDSQVTTEKTPLLLIEEGKEANKEAGEDNNIQKQTKEPSFVIEQVPEPKTEEEAGDNNQYKSPVSPLLTKEGHSEQTKDDVQDDGNQNTQPSGVQPAPEEDIKASAEAGQDLEEDKEAKEKKAEDESNPKNTREPSILTMEDILGPEPIDVRLYSAAWKELNSMAGLEDVKKAIGDLMDRAKVNHRRELAGKGLLQASLNRVFLGPPGTGKSTVARLYGQILADIGLVAINNVVVTTPGDFIGEYTGESEVKTVAILNSTIGQVLIIDDAHTFYQATDRKSSHDTDDYRLGCLDMIVSQIHNKPGENRCVILVGYADLMEEMFRHVNPGLRRRFPLENAFRFKDYDDTELNYILRQRMAEEDITAEQPAMDVAAEVLRRMRDRPNFGNGGDVQNLLDLAKMRFMKRTEENRMGSTRPDNENTNNADDEELSGVVVLEQQDFDPEWNRGANASTRCSSLFEGLIGFEAIIDELQDYQRIAANMRLHGKDPRRRIPFTFVFRGPPGTGKTHTARIIGQIFYDMGFLSTNEVIECSASQLIAEWMGQTAPMVLNLLDRSLGKVLFIDEAYRLGTKGVRSSGGRSYEDEAVGELVDCLTKPRYFNKLIIVLAGYDQGMDSLMRSNPGLRGRFPTDIMFRPMTPRQCKEHLINLIHEDGIFIRDGPDANEEDNKEVLLLFHKLALTPDWANARDVKTLAGIVVAEVYRRDPEDLKVEEDAPTDVDFDARFSITTRDLVECLNSLLRTRIRRTSIK
ncbi:hypothetical protein QQZ08_005442 [Neonectria magnoliae]|uniref:AAA+ ATPase domain-containing protein n=1 Tax=Neonectria magnoliae TaxID=2732573 RepID=A0ABR1I594_9HYPO